jgi:hypothetical protein
MFCTIRARRDGPGPRRIVAAGLLALAALAAFARAGQAQEQRQGQGNILQQGDHILKQGAKLLGFATDVDPPADFVQKSRPDHDLDFIPVFQPPPEPERPALEGVNLKAVKSQLDELQKKHDALRAAYPPAAKALAEEAAAKKKPQTNAPNPQQ